MTTNPEPDQGEIRRAGVEYKKDVDGWQVVLWWPHGATGGPQEITIRPRKEADPSEVARGISTTTLRRLPLAEITRSMQELLATTDQTQQHVENMTELLRGTLAEGVSVQYLAVLSAAYDYLVKLGQRAPAVILAQWIERSHETVRGHLKQARREGLLTIVPGKPGGELTSKAKDILSGMGEIK